MKIKIIGLASGAFATPFDGQYLAEYDPTRKGFDPSGVPMAAHMVTTPDPDKAMQFPDAGSAWACWKQSVGVRLDGCPNRPLTAFSIEFVP